MSQPGYVPSSISRARNIADLRRMAREKLPRMVFDYIDGGADDEVTLARSVSRFRDIELVWDALADVAEIDTSTTIMGAPSASPFFISPTATSRLFHPRGGELAVARAAHAAGVPYACSTLASSSVEDIAAANPGTKWFQVYVWRDRALVKEMLRYPWPGNVRELQHAVERAVIMARGDKLQPEDFFFRQPGADELGGADLPTMNLDDMEKQLIMKALQKYHGNITEAAAELGLTRASLYRRLEKYQL